MPRTRTWRHAAWPSFFSAAIRKSPAGWPNAPAPASPTSKPCAGRAGENAEGDLPALLARERTEAADALSASVIQRALRSSPLLSQRVGQYVVHPLWGVPILLGVLYLVYQFVGVFGATVLVGLLEKDLFEGILNPAFTDFVTAAVNVPVRSRNCWSASTACGPWA